MEGQKAKSDWMTPCDVLDYAENLLLDRFPDRTLRFHKWNVPAYEWSGAGSERGGSSGHLNFDRLIFAKTPEIGKKKSLVISIGRDSGGMDTSVIPCIMYGDGSIEIPVRQKMYGVFRAILPESVVEKMLEKYDFCRDYEWSSYKDEDKKGKIAKGLTFMISKFLKRNNNYYNGISLFVMDSIDGGTRRGFFVKERPFYNGFNSSLLRRLENPEISGGDRESGIGSANKLANLLLTGQNFVFSDSLMDFKVDTTEMKRLLDETKSIFSPQ